MQWSIYVGDICSAPVDVICTSTNPHLELILGTGGAVRDTGGWSIQEECKHRIRQEQERNGHGWLEPGTAVLTGAGTLAFRGVIHCVAIDAFHDSTAAVVRKCVCNVLNVAAGMTPPPESICMPVFATGHGRLGLADSLAAMIDALETGNCWKPQRICICSLTERDAAEISRTIKAYGGIDLSPLPPAH